MFHEFIYDLGCTKVSDGVQSETREAWPLPVATPGREKSVKPGSGPGKARPLHRQSFLVAKG